MLFHWGSSVESCFCCLLKNNNYVSELQVSLEEVYKGWMGYGKGNRKEILQVHKLHKYLLAFIEPIVTILQQSLNHCQRVGHELVRLMWLHSEHWISTLQLTGKGDYYPIMGNL